MASDSAKACYDGRAGHRQFNEESRYGSIINKVEKGHHLSYLHHRKEPLG